MFQFSGDGGNVATLLHYNIVNIYLSTAITVICFLIQYKLTSVHPDGVECTHLA